MPLQSKTALDLISTLLGDPLDHSTVKRAEPAGEHASSLAFFSGEYPIIENIPRLRVSDDVLARIYGQQHLNAWKVVQAAGERSYASVGAIGNFATEHWKPALDAGRLLRETIGSGKLVLDVGCGLLPEPSYMTAAGKDITFVGVDPMCGQVERRFPFAESYGDFLPFAPAVFDAVQFISSLDHMINPLKALRDAFIIMKPGGTLLIEETIRAKDARYRGWWLRSLFGPVRYNEFHNFAFTISSLQRVARRAGFVGVRLLSTRDIGEVCLLAHRPQR